MLEGPSFGSSMLGRKRGSNYSSRSNSSTNSVRSGRSSQIALAIPDANISYQDLDYTENVSSNMQMYDEYSSSESSYEWVR